MKTTENYLSDQGKPSCTIIWRKKPNDKLMAKAYLEMYERDIKEKKEMKNGQ